MDRGVAQAARPQLCPPRSYEDERGPEDALPTSVPSHSSIFFVERGGRCWAGEVPGPGPWPVRTPDHFPSALGPMRQLHPLHAHDPWWPLILGCVHQAPGTAEYSLSGRHIRDAAALTRCSRGTAGRLVLPNGTRFVQVERIAAIYNRCHAWMDRSLSVGAEDGLRAFTSEGERLSDLLVVDYADAYPSPFSPWSPWSEGA